MLSKIPKKGIDLAKNGAVIIPIKHGKKMVSAVKKAKSSGADYRICRMKDEYDGRDVIVLEIGTGKAMSLPVRNYTEMLILINGISGIGYEHITTDVLETMVNITKKYDK